MAAASNDPGGTAIVTAPPLSAHPSKAERCFAVVGNPNAGKTSLFNALTGMRQKVGNYPGVTVERKEGTFFSQHGKPMLLIDLPGAYSLTARSPDEAILQDVLLGRRRDVPAPDAVICVLDAGNLERNLFLASQVIEMGRPVVLVLNMMDEAEARGVKIDRDKLSKRLGVPVIAAQAHRGVGVRELRLALSSAQLPVPAWQSEVPPLVGEALDEIAQILQEEAQMHRQAARVEAYLLLTEGAAPPIPGSFGLPPLAISRACVWRQRLDADLPGWRSELVSHRYAEISNLCREVIRRHDPDKPALTERIDQVLLHPVWGWIVFASLMIALFYSVFTLSGPPMDLIDGIFGALGGWLEGLMPAGDLRSLIVEGIIAGVGGVVIFLPQILLLFLFVSILEGSGYMSRAAFLLDRLMGKVGLHGRAFIPLLSSYACAIPGIMATRTMESPKDRLVTIFIAPFMSCSARLPVYLLLIAALVPAETAPAAVRAGFLFLFYFLGTATAFAVAWCFKKTLLKGVRPPLLMELPPYRLPRFRQVGMELYERSMIFLRRAGTIIFGLSILLWFGTTFPKPPEDFVEGQGSALEYSMAGQLGKVVEPIFEPLGYDWQINIGILASFAAREVFVSTMAIVYEVEGGDEAEEATLVESLRAQKRDDGSPLFTPLTCMSILIFFVYALQCISTVAVVKRETNSWRWPVFQLVFMTAVAYLAALIVYQGGRLLGFT